MGDNYGYMLSSIVSSQTAASGFLRAGGAMRRRVMPWLLVAVLGTTVGTGQQAPQKAESQDPGKPAATKPVTNPLAILTKGKPVAQVVPVVPQELPPAIPEPPVGIALPDVVARSQDLSQLLREAASKLPTREQIDAVLASIADIEPNLKTKESEVQALLSGSPNSLELREEENFWRGMERSEADWQQQLLNWANNAQTTISLLDEQEPAWAATLEENKDNHELGPVLTVVQDNLVQIRKLRALAQEALQISVNMQIKVGYLDQATEGVISQLAQAKAKLKGHLLDRDSLPLWKVGERREIGESRSVFSSVSTRWISTGVFLKDNRGTIFFLFLLLIVSVVLSRQLYLITRDKQAADDLEAATFRVLRHWFAVGLLPPLLLGYVLAPSAPVTLLGLGIVVSFIPILIILPPLVTRRFRLLLYFFAGIYTLNWAISWVSLNPASKRELQFGLTSVLFLVMAYLVRPLRTEAVRVRGWSLAFLLAVRFGVLALGIALAADLFGYVKLARYLGVACVYSAFIGIGVLTVLRVFSLLLTVGLRSPQAERIAAVRLHRGAIEKWAPRALKWTGIAIWITGTIELAGVDNVLTGGIDKFLAFPLAGSSSNITPGSTLGFFFILVGGYGIASAVRFIFREEIFRRFHMARGLPELMSSVIYYFLLVIVFLAAVSAGNIELNKFTVLTGAFGVGIGFGMQNIINNFVSGLILQFERPIHVDDIIEVDTNTGKVTRIGVRSSTIQTAQGAEVIIPNASLISSKVINWTLSESQRRRELPVGVAYGTDPKIVLKLLREAATRHELVLSKPEPLVYFIGFGESSLNFELHFWVMQENNGLEITSEVALAVMKSFEAAGIEIPFPQRDLHLRTTDDGGRDPLAAIVRDQLQRLDQTAEELPSAVKRPSKD